MSELLLKFDKLCKEVHDCILCPRMKDSQRVLNYSAGNLKAELMFIGEAPGRLGADASEIPFHGDKSGNNFEALLEFAGINRKEVFITNSALCNPKDEKGNNTTPSKREIENCNKFLMEQIQLVNPKIVVTLGAMALEATKSLSTHNFSLKGNVRTTNQWFNRLLIPLYHPGQRAMIHRSFANQRSDYQFVKEQLGRINNQTNRKVTGKTAKDVLVVVDYIFTLFGELSYFALHKIFYLIEYQSISVLNRRLTNAYIVRQKDGPYCTDLHLSKLQKGFPLMKISKRNGALYLGKGQALTLFDQQDLMTETILDNEEKELINQVIKKYGGLSHSELKTKVYLTLPMREMLKKESEMKINLYNAPIFS